MDDINKAWMTEDGTYLDMDEIADSHLLNIVKFLERGGGHSWFLDVVKIVDLFDETDRRGLSHRCSLGEAIRRFEEKSENYSEMLEYKYEIEEW